MANCDNAAATTVGRYLPVIVVTGRGDSDFNGNILDNWVTFFGCIVGADGGPVAPVCGAFDSEAAVVDLSDDDGIEFVFSDPL